MLIAPMITVRCPLRRWSQCDPHLSFEFPIAIRRADFPPARVRAIHRPTALLASQLFAFVHVCNGSPVSNSVFKLESTRGQPSLIPRSISEPGSSSSCVTVKRTISSIGSISNVTRVCFALFARVSRECPSQHQAPKRRALDYLADQIDRARCVEATMLPARSGFPVRHVLAAPVLASEFRVEQRLPDLLRRCPDIRYIHELRLSHQRLLPVASGALATRPGACARTS